MKEQQLWDKIYDLKPSDNKTFSFGLKAALYYPPFKDKNGVVNLKEVENELQRQIDLLKNDLEIIKTIQNGTFRN